VDRWYSRNLLHCQILALSLMPQIAKYFFVGGASAAVDIGLFYIFASILLYDWLLVSCSTFVIATLFNYVLSSSYVFNRQTEHSRTTELLKIFVVSTTALLIHQFTLWATLTWLEQTLLIAKFAGTLSSFLWNFFGRRNWVFK